MPTKMGGRDAPDDLEKGAETQAWLAVSDDEDARVSGRYFFHKRVTLYLPEAGNIEFQERFIDLCSESAE